MDNAYLTVKISKINYRDDIDCCGKLLYNRKVSTSRILAVLSKKCIVEDLANVLVTYVSVAFPTTIAYS